MYQAPPLKATKYLDGSSRPAVIDSMRRLDLVFLDSIETSHTAVTFHVFIEKTLFFIKIETR